MAEPVPANTLATSDNPPRALICLVPRMDQTLAIEQAGTKKAEDLHLPLADLGPIGNMNSVPVEKVLQDFAADWGPIVGGYIDGIGSFGPKGTNKLTIGLVQAPDLARFRTNLVDRLAEAGILLDSEYDFIPHITLADGPILHEESVWGLPVDFDDIYLYWDNKIECFPLTGNGEVEVDMDRKDSYRLEPNCIHCPANEPFGVILDESEVLIGCHVTEESAQAQIDALSTQENTVSPDPRTRPPKNSGEGSSSLSIEDMSEDDLISELARRALAGVNSKIETALLGENEDDLEVFDDIGQAEGFAVVATGKPGLPIADRDHAWDAGAAEKRVAKYASSDGSGDPDMFDWPRYGDAFICRDKSAGHSKEGYKLPFADVIDGKLTMIPKGVFAAAGRVGQTDIPSEDVGLIKARIARFYKEMASHFKDPSIKAPWITSEGEAVELDSNLADAHVGDPVRGSDRDPRDGDGTPSGDQYDWHGVLTVEGLPSGDGRMIESGCLQWRDLPLPLMLKTITSPGHDGADFAGWICEIERVAPDIIGRGNFADTTAGLEAAKILGDTAGNNRFGVSADIDSATAEFVDADTGEAITNEDMLFGGSNVIEKLTSGRLMGATLTPFPAFQEAYIEVLSSPKEDSVLVASGSSWSGDVWRTHVPGRFALQNEELALVASGATVTAINEALIAPPADWFNLQPMDEPTPFTVHPDGRIYGLVAEFGTCHIGFNDRCVDVPRNADFRSFYGGRTIITADGTVVKAGSIIMDTVHPSLRFNASDTQAFYAHTGSAVADVALHTNEWGIVAAGSVRPDADPIHVRNLRASDVSPDWRSVDRTQTLVALLAVNLSGFIVQSLVASGGEIPTLRPRALIDTVTGEVLSLVAAGAIQRERPRSAVLANEIATMNDRFLELETEIAQLKLYVHGQRVAASMSKLAPFTSRQQMERSKRAAAAMARFSGGSCAPLSPNVIEVDLVASCDCGGTCGGCDDGFSDGFADKSAAGRRESAKKGHAMKDGSYPIETIADLNDAIHAVGRGNAPHNEIRRHIMKRARALKSIKLIPENWNKDGSIKA